MTDATPTLGHNGATPFDIISERVEALYLEAKNWADGEPIASQEQHDAVERLHDMLHEAGKDADAARVEEKKPLDEQVAEIQRRWNTLIGNTKSQKGRVVVAKEALQAVLTPWRQARERERIEAARIAREEAERLAQEAQQAMRASSGNLEAREEAEVIYQEARQAERFANRVGRAAVTGTGLRSVWHADLVDAEVALDWAYGREPARFMALVQQMADEAVRTGTRAVPGFDVSEERRAA